MAAKARQKLINVPHAAWDEFQVVSQVEIVARINFVASAAFRGAHNQVNRMKRTAGQMDRRTDERTNKSWVIFFSCCIQSNAKMIERLLHEIDDSGKKKKSVCETERER